MCVHVCGVCMCVVCACVWCVHVCGVCMCVVCACVWCVYVARLVCGMPYFNTHFPITLISHPIEVESSFLGMAS